MSYEKIIIAMYRSDHPNELFPREEKNLGDAFERRHD